MNVSEDSAGRWGKASETLWTLPDTASLCLGDSQGLEG